MARERMEEREADALNDLAVAVGFIQDLSPAISMPSVSRKKGQMFVSRLRDLEAEVVQLKDQLDLLDFALPIDNLLEPGMSEGALKKLDQFVINKVGRSEIPEDERKKEPKEGEDENNKTERQEEEEEEKDEKGDEDEEEDNLEELEQTMDIISRLRSHLDDFFPPPGLELEQTMILHDDLSRQNILVNNDGNLTAVVDWECISALPLWMACQIPPLLQGKPLDEEPVKSTYQHDEDGNVVELFWEHVDNYELSQLRRVFLGEMQRLQPQWVEIFESSQRQRDFDLAVSSCNDSFLIRRIRNWLDDMDKGVEGFQGLEERIDNASL